MIDTIQSGSPLALLFSALLRSSCRFECLQKKKPGVQTKNPLAGSVFVLVDLLFSGYMLADGGERLLVRATSNESRYYLTYAQSTTLRGCKNPVYWYDPQVAGSVTVCSTFPLFDRSTGWNVRRLAIVYVLTGPYGIRVLSIHALDSFFGQQDWEAMKKGNQS